MHCAAASDCVHPQMRRGRRMHGLLRAGVGRRPSQPSLAMGIACRMSCSPLSPGRLPVRLPRPLRCPLQFNQINGLELVCRAHQLVQEGLKYMFPDRNLVTVCPYLRPSLPGTPPPFLPCPSCPHSLLPFPSHPTSLFPLPSPPFSSLPFPSLSFRSLPFASLPLPSLPFSTLHFPPLLFSLPPSLPPSV